MNEEKINEVGDTKDKGKEKTNKEKGEVKKIRDYLELLGRR